MHLRNSAPKSRLKTIVISILSSSPNANPNPIPNLNHIRIPLPSGKVLNLTVLTVYSVLIWFMLEHNTVIWSPHLKYNIEAIELVQRRFTKWLPGLNNYTYSERLCRLNIPTLELHCLHSDLIRCYRITFGCINVTTTKFLTTSTITTRGHPYKLYK